MMKVNLLHHTPLWVCSTAIRKCWASEDKSDTEFLRALYGYEGFEDYIDGTPSNHTDFIIGTKDKELIERVGNKNKHSSTLEHLNYTFDIDGISRACLQELARHRHASLSVKSTRYTLKELKDEQPFWSCQQHGGSLEDMCFDFNRIKKYCVLTTDSAVNEAIAFSLESLRTCLMSSNDLAKYCLPEAYKTSLIWTINARSLQNFLALRTSKAALWEIRELATAIYKELPEEHKYLFKEFMNNE